MADISQWPASSADDGVKPEGRRLESWKEIAAYVGRSEKTVRRWEERERLPVHRLYHEKRGSVYAYTAEIEEWRETKKVVADTELVAELTEGPSPQPAQKPARRQRRLWLAAASTLLVVAAGAYWWLTVHPAFSRPTVTVLPFVNTDDNSSIAYLSEGVPAAITEYLSQMSELQVYTFRTAMAVKKPGSGMVLSGRVRKADPDLQIDVALGVSADAPIWAASYRIAESRLPDLQQEIALWVRDEVSSETAGTKREAAAAKAGGLDPATKRSMSEGAKLLERFAPSRIKRAIGLFEEAGRQDPRWFRPHAMLGIAFYSFTAVGDAPAVQSFERQRREALAAVKLAPSLGIGWSLLGPVHLYLDLDFPAAEKDFRKAIQLGPKDASPKDWYAVALQEMRRFDEARRYLEQSIELAPTGLCPNMDYGNNFYLNGNWDRAIAQYRHTLDLDPDWGMTRVFLGKALLEKGQHSEAIEELRHADETLERSAWSHATLGHALAVTGHKAEAERMLVEMLQKRERGYYPAFAIGVTQLGLGRPEAALDWLERAVDERNFGYYMPNADLIYKTLRGNPRFQNLLRRLNFLG